MVNPYPPTPPATDDELPTENELLENLEEIPDYHARFLSQAVISGIVLILIFGITQMHFQWAGKARRYLHCAINATTMETFGVIAEAAFFKSMINSVSNLVRLEEISKQISSGVVGFRTEQEIFQNWSWPLKGNITKRFGWETEVSGNVKRFYPGIEITAPSNYTVNAVASGRVTEIRQEESGAWLITIEHGQGWKSSYHNLDQIQVKVGQYVNGGEILSRLAGREKNLDSKMGFELKKDDQPVDPLTVLVNF